MIPTRLGSTRFPGKALADETGRPLILHVVDRARAASSVERVIVTAPDPEIIRIVEEAGVEAIETSFDHPNGTSRLAEVADRLASELPTDAIIVNVQGDEPELDPAAIDAVILALNNDSEADMSTIATPFGPDGDPADPNQVKVVIGLNGQAIYFSRSLIPFDRDAVGATPLRHVGLYAYRRDFLQRFASWPESPLEQAERLEQLRVLEHGGRIAVAIHASDCGGIDTPEQYAAFVARWRSIHGT
ncbi:MAG: 3-deoxy-manno-octulosonate cytidylyltransferase [Planctomycetota bacterium]|nr:3-deoxy-manno-octulosonate cytidylyltransferase [Planctomycetota bacterium]MDA1026507.1 3-deoxy-manno-octulosonate cytidylyltransferase [Planctomycetota bacterium]